MRTLDISSGCMTIVWCSCAGDVTEWITDADFAIRAAEAMDPSDGSTVLRVRAAKDAGWQDLLRWPQDETGGGLAFTKDGSSMFVLVTAFVSSG